MASQQKSRQKSSQKNAASSSSDMPTADRYGNLRLTRSSARSPVKSGTNGGIQTRSKNQYPDDSGKRSNNIVNKPSRSKTSKKVKLLKEAEETESDDEEETENSSARGSTLSLHLAKFASSLRSKNPATETPEDSRKRNAMRLLMGHIKKCCTNSTTTTTFPRQQDNEEPAPEVATFRASQKILKAVSRPKIPQSQQKAPETPAKEQKTEKEKKAEELRRYEQLCSKVDEAIEGFEEDTIIDVITVHAVVTRFFGKQNLVEMCRDVGIQNPTLHQFTAGNIRKKLSNAIALKFHPDKGGDPDQCKYLIGPFKDFINNNDMIKAYSMYLCAMDSFHRLLPPTNGEWTTHQTVPLPNGFPEQYLPIQHAKVTKLNYLTREIPLPLFCHPKLLYNDEKKVFRVGDYEFQSDGDSVKMAYKAKFGRHIYFALRFTESPNLVFWIRRQDALNAKYLDTQAKNAFFRFKNIKREAKLQKFSMELRTVDQLKVREIPDY